MLPSVLPEVYWRIRWRWRKTPRELLEDALQNAAVAVMEMEDPPRTATRLEATLFVIARRNIATALRQRSQGMDWAQLAADPTSAPDSVEKQVYLRELIVMIRNSPLTVRTRGAFLRLLSGKTVAEIAMALKLKKQYVWLKIQKARRWLRGNLEGAGDDPKGAEMPGGPHGD